MTKKKQTHVKRKVTALSPITVLRERTEMPRRFKRQSMIIAGQLGIMQSNGIPKIVRVLDADVEKGFMVQSLDDARSWWMDRKHVHLIIPIADHPTGF